MKATTSRLHERNVTHMINSRAVIKHGVSHDLLGGGDSMEVTTGCTNEVYGITKQSTSALQDDLVMADRTQCSVLIHVALAR